MLIRISDPDSFIDDLCSIVSGDVSVYDGLSMSVANNQYGELSMSVANRDKLVYGESSISVANDQYGESSNNACTHIHCTYTHLYNNPFQVKPKYAQNVRAFQLHGVRSSPGQHPGRRKIIFLADIHDVGWSGVPAPSQERKGLVTPLY